MIVIDTSALVAMLTKEPETDAFLTLTLAADIRLISAATLLEARMVLHSRNDGLIDDLDALISKLNISIEPVTARQSDIAFGAFRRFGKGRGHLAALNYGDCFAYALARDRSAPLLFKGNDFIHTDVASAVDAV